MKELMRRVGRNEKCPCGSGKKYKRCCGLGVNENFFQTDVIKVTENKTHHFILCSVGVEKDEGAITDENGKVLVFLSRSASMQFVHKYLNEEDNVISIGMGDQKWALFQKEVAYVLVNSDGDEI